MRYLKTICFLLVFCATNTIIAQRILTVNNKSGTIADYKTIQEAVDAANNGDYIYVQPSTSSYGDVTINKEIHLRGSSHSLKNYITQVGMFTLLTNSNASSIEGFRCGAINTEENNGTDKRAVIKNCFIGDNGYFFKKVKNIVFKGNVIKEKGEENSMTYFGDGSININFENNIFYRKQGAIHMNIPQGSSFKNNIINMDFINIYPSESLFEIENCIFISNQGGAYLTVYVPDGGEFMMKNCVTYNYNEEGDYNTKMGSGSTGSLEKINCYENTNPQFVKVSTTGNSIGNKGFNPDEDDVRLKSNAPVPGAGVYGE